MTAEISELLKKALALPPEARAALAGSLLESLDDTVDPGAEEAEKRARAIVRATTHYNDPKVLLEVSEDLTGAMKGLAIAALDEAHLLQTRGW